MEFDDPGFSVRFLTGRRLVGRIIVPSMDGPTTLKTSMGEGTRAGFSFFAMGCLFGLAALFYSAGEPPFTWVSIVPALLGVLLLFNGIHSLLASRTPPTTLTLGSCPVRRGESVSVTIRQEGPVALESLRASLICERIVRETKKARIITYPHQLNFFDSGSCEVGSLVPHDFPTSVTVPADGEPSIQYANLIVEWRIEVWGKVRGSADFMRPFIVEVI